MFKQLKALQKEGFTLIELMIVVAIIGILAAIAIPNFLAYQMKSRQSEAKTNLQAIKTSEVAFQAERGCYLEFLQSAGAVPRSAALKRRHLASGCWYGASPVLPARLFGVQQVCRVWEIHRYRVYGNRVM